MTTTFRIQCGWPPDHHRAGLTPGERPLADIRITAGDHCLTRFRTRSGNTTGEAPRLSAMLLAAWLAANSWRILCEPMGNSLDWRMSHNLAAAGGGFLWPSITIWKEGDGLRVLAQANPPDNDEPIRYLEGCNILIDTREFQQEADSFIQETIRRSGNPEGELAVLWACILEERADHKTRDLREREARLGYDPGEVPLPVS